MHLNRVLETLTPSYFETNRSFSYRFGNGTMPYDLTWTLIHYLSEELEWKQLLPVYNTI